MHKISMARQRPAVFRGACALVVALLVAGTTQSLLAGQAPATASTEGGGTDYIIGAGDVLQIFVWKEPDLTRNVTVRLDGKITVPLVGELRAAGQTPEQLTGELRAALTRYIAAPQVTLGVLQPNSARFYVMGQVMRPGDFPLTGRLSVVQGLALAGGFKEFAKTGDIVIIRNEGGTQRFVPVDYKRLEDGRDLGQNVALRAGDTVLVP